MLQIKNIKKKYVTGDLVQVALDNVSLSFREHELVAILGPSGSGKSTLLNVIGGLDHYDSGDLIINGISTKKYTDRDWDSYRNHSVGFIFQSYNLIPHQTVLANVELALTISGIPARERKKRAMEALKNVGLEKQVHKKPNQMSGGQMQRVAIARALVNNPKILLADEPTGALDSETSIQVMELLKEVAKDRLVVMVTHNPELAQQYASRIVRVKDGKILDDSDPFQPDISAQEPPVHKNMGHSSMGFGSALVLSFQNLRTKKARTLLTAFAGSIGIIGIALILSLSAGFQAYVDSIQRDTLANYPLTFQAETADMSAAFMSMMMPDEDPGEEVPDTVLESQMLARMFAHIGVNDLKSFKAHLEDHREEVSQMVNSIQYGYGIRPRIYTENAGEEPFQVNPATLFKEITGNDGISAMMDVDAFQNLPEDRDMLDQQYEVVKGRWPEKYDELVFILPMGGRIADQTAYTLGLKSMDHMDQMLELMEEGLSPITDEPPMQWTYDQLMDLKFKWVPTPDFYRYNEEFRVWEDLADEPGFLENALKDALELHVVGIVSPREGSSAILMPGLGYPTSFTEHVIENAAESEIVRAQLENPDVDVFSGVGFNSDELRSPPDFSSMISINKDAISSSFGVDISEQAISELMQYCMDEIQRAAQVDTTRAQQAFVETFRELAGEMLLEAVADGGGTAELTLSNAEDMVHSFMGSAYAAERIQALAAQYSVSPELFTPVYEPLLAGLVSHIIATDTLLPDLPPVKPEETQPQTEDTQPQTEATQPQTEGTQPQTEGTQPQTENPVETGPAETSPSEELLPGETEQQLPPETEGNGSLETDGPTEEISVPEPPAAEPDNELPAPESVPDTEAAELETSVTLSLLSNITIEETSIPENEVPAETFTEGTLPQEPTFPGIMFPENGDLPQIPDVPLSLDGFRAKVTEDEIVPFIDSFCELDMVTQSAQIVSTKMMEATAMESVIRRLSGMDDVFTGFIRKAFYVDTGALSNAFRFNMDEEKIQRLFEALMNGQEARSAASNLRKLGYADLDSPSTMSVYFKDFDSKELFLEFLEDYNKSMRDSDQEGKVIRYTDMTGRMMDSVRIIINSVSYVLIAFVAVSLVVSSIMIGIITYISVMERTKEIGVLRAMGASKHNISQVFNAETFIIGLISGILGIGITLALLVPGNRLLFRLSHNAQITAQLPWTGAIILIILSMCLTLLGGLIPSRQAAKKDPVIALRSE